MIKNSSFVEAMGAVSTTDQDILGSYLDSRASVDIGYVESLDGNGKATIALAQFMEAEQARLVGVEIVYPGNASGAYACCTPGTTCLVFIPRSCMPNVTDQGIYYTAASNSALGAKAMPISTGINNSVRMCINDCGGFDITTPDYELHLSDQSISLKHGNKLYATKESDGTLSMGYITGEAGPGAKRSELSVIVSEEGVEQKMISEEGNAITTVSQNADGSFQYLQTDNADSPTTLAQLGISPEGAVTVTINNNISIATTVGDSSNKHTLTLESDSIVITGKEDITMTGALDVNSGNLTVDANG